MFLELSRLEVRHAGHAQAAVQALTLALRAGDIGVLIGPSGCGKTSLLRAVAGLTPVSGGEIPLSGGPVRTSPLRAGDIGVLIGPSGCGKTSLLRAVAGLTPVSGGEIRLSGSLVGSAALSVP